MQNTLEEERRYSAQLQREVNQFSEDVHRTKNHSESHYGTSRERSQLLEEEKALLETQVTALEEGKKLRKSINLIRIFLWVKSLKNTIYKCFILQYWNYSSIPGSRTTKEKSRRHTAKAYWKWDTA